MGIELTDSSRKEMSLLTSGRLTPAMAAEYLKEERIFLRSFSDTLLDMGGGYSNIYKKLLDAFTQAYPEADRDSTARKLRNWLSGTGKPGSREDVFLIGFALGLSEQQTGYLLGECTDYGIHYREGHDIVYSWFLRNGRTFLQAREFFGSLPVPTQTEPLPAGENSRITLELYNAFRHVYDEDQLRDCYLKNLDLMGSLHLRAHRYYRMYIQQLIRPASEFSGIDEEVYSIDSVMDRYFSLHMPSTRKRSSYSVVQRLIKHNWPNATYLKNIGLYKEDVSRKLLLLLYITTENIIGDEYSELDEEYLTVEERVEEHWYTLNAILTDCGMPSLDPRSPMDWLVLYALTASPDEPMSARMEQVIDGVFAGMD